MRAQPPETKPVFDAVTDALTAVGDLIRSLRETAKDARRKTQAATHEAKSGVRGAASHFKSGVKHAESTVKDRVRVAWNVLAHGDAAPSGHSAPVRKQHPRKKPARES